MKKKQPQGPASESNVQARVKLAAAKADWRLFRNNSGAGELLGEEGGRSFLRWGLGNESKELCEKLASPDLVGWRRVLITPEMVGTTIAQCVGIEVKKEGWKFTGTARETAQKTWLDLLRADGGYADFISDPKDLETGK